MESKICTKCSAKKLSSEFYFIKHTQKYRSECISCERNRRVLYYKNKKEEKKSYQKLNKIKIKNYKKERYEKGKDKLLLNQKKYYLKNKVEINKYNSVYSKNNREKINANIRKRTKEDFLFNLKNKIRGCIKSSFKSKKFQKKNKSIKILGCSIQDFKAYIENKFEPWMNWGNHGKYDANKMTWQLDHIIPVSSAKTEGELISLNHYTNFQPLESMENILKANKL